LKLPSNISPELNDLMTKLFKKNPEERIGTCIIFILRKRSLRA
jgi:hypothetical protein